MACRGRSAYAEIHSNRLSKEGLPLAGPSTEVVVWFSRGVPTRLVWAGGRCRVTDTPTPLTEDAWSPPMTHAASRIVGWRFQGTAADGRCHMFEIAEGDRAWHVLRVYD